MSAAVLTERRGMKTITPRPPRLPKPKKAEEFPPVNFNVLHGRVIESFEAKIPVVHGGGVTVRGYGRSWVDTTVHNTFSAWFVDHQTGQQHKIDFGQDYLDMRYGHDVTMLWANKQLFAINNHTTNRIKYPALHRPILPDRQVGGFFGNLFFHVCVFPMMLVASWYFLILFIVLLEKFFMTAPLSVHHNHMVHHAEPSTALNNPLVMSVFLLAVALISLVPSVLRLLRNSRNRKYNAAQHEYLTQQLNQAEDQWIRQYSPPRIAAR
jgi:hypothetical protein